MLNVELIDNAGWELLIKLSEQMGFKEMASEFRTALQQEADHLMHVRRWVEQGCVSQAGLLVT